MSPRAPRPCNERGCTSLVHDPTRRRCDEHYKPWDGHRRHKGIAHREFRENTEAHRIFKSRVLGACGYRCEIKRPGICLGAATEVDRKDNQKGYTDDNCQGACKPCHQWKTSQEGHAARGHTTQI